MIFNQAAAQQATSASGTSCTGSGGQVSFTVGLTCFKDTDSASGSVSQGVQHAFEILVGVAEAQQTSMLSLHPNPTTDKIVIRVRELYGNMPTFELVDLQGSTLKSGKIHQGDTTVDMSSVPSATYLLRVCSALNSNIQTLTIIKR